MRTAQRKLVIFGAGKIGRSFIGQIFGTGGYEIVFVDIYKPLIDELNTRGNYNVIIKSDNEYVINISNVRGVHSEDKEKVISEVATAGIIAVSVGLGGLSGVFPLLAEGLIKRYSIDRNSALDIIIAENMRNADEYFKGVLETLLPGSYPLGRLVGLVETSIGKMVPIMKKADIDADILQIFAEPYNSLIVSRNEFKNPVPAIDGIAPKENIKAWVDRKLFVHNLGHASAAYIGYLYNPGFVYLYEALAVPEVFSFVRKTMLQSSDILMNKYPGEFGNKDLEEHIDDLLSRFQNKSLGDTIFRVGCDLGRKLGPEDRLTGAIRAAKVLKLPYNRILFTLICAFRFGEKDEDGNMLNDDIDIINQFDRKPVSALIRICGFSRKDDPEVLNEALKTNQVIINSLSTGKNFAELLQSIFSI